MQQPSKKLTKKMHLHHRLVPLSIPVNYHLKKCCLLQTAIIKMLHFHKLCLEWHLGAVCRTQVKMIKDYMR